MRSTLDNRSTEMLIRVRLYQSIVLHNFNLCLFSKIVTYDISFYIIFPCNWSSDLYIDRRAFRCTGNKAVFCNNRQNSLLVSTKSTAKTTAICFHDFCLIVDNIWKGARIQYLCHTLHPCKFEHIASVVYSHRNMPQIIVMLHWRSLKTRLICFYSFVMLQ